MQPSYYFGLKVNLSYHMNVMKLKVDFNLTLKYFDLYFINCFQFLKATCHFKITNLFSFDNYFDYGVDYYIFVLILMRLNLNLMHFELSF